LDPSSASCRILKRELEVEGILLSIVAGLITCSDSILSANVYRKYQWICAELEAAGSGGRGGDGSAQRKSMCKYYFISMTSTIYPMLVLIVKGMIHVHTKYSNQTSK
jgi:hypothetical protein